MGLVRNIAIGLGVAGVAIAFIELNNQGAADASEEEAVYGDELYTEPVVADVPAMAPAEEVDDFANGGHDAGNGNELVNAVAGVAGGLAVGRLIPGVGAASLAHMALSEVNDRWAREGAANLLEENGNVDDLRRYEKRHELYDQSIEGSREIYDGLLDTFLPIPEDAPPILQAVVDGAKETLVDAIHAPLELVKTVDSAVMALHAITPTPEETGAAIKDAFETVGTAIEEEVLQPIKEEVLEPIKEKVLVPVEEALERVGQEIENLVAPVGDLFKAQPPQPPWSDGTICAAGTTCNTRCKGGKSFYEFPHQRCGDEAYRLARVAQEKRDREAQEKRDREAQEKRDPRLQPRRD